MPAGSTASCFFEGRHRRKKSVSSVGQGFHIFRTVSELDLNLYLHQETAHRNNIVLALTSLEIEDTSSSSARFFFAIAEGTTPLVTTPH